MHSKDIIHRDLKPENIMLKYENLNSLKIVDFGLSIHKNQKSPTFSRCGTVGFVAPEVLRSMVGKIEYDEKCDIFSVGVIVYNLLTGHRLVKGSNQADIVKNTVIGYFNELEANEDNLLSPLSIDLITSLTQLDPKKRISASEALAHPYFAESQVRISQKKQGFSKGIQQIYSQIKVETSPVIIPKIPQSIIPKMKHFLLNELSQ